MISQVSKSHIRYSGVGWTKRSTNFQHSTSLPIWELDTNISKPRAHGWTNSGVSPPMAVPRNFHCNGDAPWTSTRTQAVQAKVFVAFCNRNDSQDYQQVPLLLLVGNGMNSNGSSNSNDKNLMFLSPFFATVMNDPHCYPMITKIAVGNIAISPRGQLHHCSYHEFLGISCLKLPDVVRPRLEGLLYRNYGHC